MKRRILSVSAILFMSMAVSFLVVRAEKMLFPQPEPDGLAIP
jgi:hypothetical protein